jgi:uncharacterized iron-regulated membrane protein
MSATRLLLRKALGWSHRWLGFIFGAGICVLAVTGGIVTFRPQIAMLLSPAATGGRCVAQVDWNAAQPEIGSYARTSLNRIYAPEAPETRYRFRMSAGKSALYTHVIFDACSAKLLGTANLRWMDWMVDFQHNLRLRRSGRWWAGWAGVLLLVSAIGGIAIWLMSSPIAARFIRWRGGVRLPRDLHSTLGVAAGGLLLVASFTSLWLCFPQTTRGALAMVAAIPAETRAPRPLAPEAGTRAADLGDILRSAQVTIPDGRVREVRWSEGYGNAGVRMWRPGDFRSLGNNVVTVNRVTAQAIAIDRYENKAATGRFLQAVTALHYGEWGGLPVRDRYGAAGLLCALMFVTGILHWWLREAARGVGDTQAGRAGARRQRKPPSHQPWKGSLMNRKVSMLLLLFAAGAGAQVDRASITGTLRDPSGSAVADAVVSVTYPETGLRRKVVTNSSGVFLIAGLPVGHAVVDAAKEGFRPQRMETDINVGETKTLELSLEIATLEASVQVVGEAELARDSAAIGATFQSSQISQLPINGRNWGSMMTLTPGAIDTGAGNGASVRFFAQGGDDNNFRIDGVDATSVRNQAESKSRLMISEDAIAEFRVNAQLYTAETGGATGGQVEIVSKSGTNQYHGSLFEYLRNSAVDSRSPFDGSRLPEFQMNQFGATAGGPISKDRTFLFLSYEGLIQRQGKTQIGFVPSDTFRAAAVPAVQPLMKLYPEGQAPIAGNPNVMQWTGVSHATQDEHAGLVRLDHRFSDKLSGYFRFSENSTTSFAPNAALPYGTKNLDAPTSGLFDFLYLAGPRTTNELRVGADYAQPLNSIPSGAEATISIPSLSSIPGGNRRIAIGITQSLVDQWSTLRGAHTVKAGLELRRVQLIVHDFNLSDGTASYASLSDFQNDKLSTLAGSGELPTKQMRKMEYFGYVQDEWKIRPNLTANLGLRYEFFNAFHEIQNRDVPFDVQTCGGYCAAGSDFAFPPTHNFAPRLSLAWSPEAWKGRTVIRAGAGIFYGDAQLGDQYSPANNDAVRYTLTSSSAPGLAYPFDPFINPNTALASAPRSMPRNHQNQTSQQWGLSVQQALSSRVTFQVGYNGQENYHVFSRTYVNVLNPVTHTAPFPNLSQEIDVRGEDGVSSFHGLVSSLQVNHWHGLLVRVNYMFAHALNDGSAGGGSGNYPENVACRSCEKGNSDYDAREVFTANFAYEIPLGRNRWFGGWQWSGTSTARSGLPLNVTVTRKATDVRDGNVLSPQRPNLVPGVPLYLDYGATGLWLNPAAFAVPAVGTWGSLGRDVLRAPGLFQIDTALSKRIPLRERLGAELGAELFNLLNHPQLAAPSSNISSTSNFGRITAPINTSPVGAGTPRQMQFFVRLSF